MTDEDLLRLYREETRLYRVYRQSVEEESRRPQVVEAKRAAWESLYRKLRRVLPPDRLRELLQAEAGEVRRKR